RSWADAPSRRLLSAQATHRERNRYGRLPSAGPRGGDGPRSVRQRAVVRGAPRREARSRRGHQPQHASHGVPARQRHAARLAPARERGARRTVQRVPRRTRPHRIRRRQPGRAREVGAPPRRDGGRARRHQGCHVRLGREFPRPRRDRVGVLRAALVTTARAMTNALDLDAIGATTQITAESLCEVIDVMPGEWVLDVATCNGNASIAAARRGAEVTTVTDAEALALPDESFDVVLSTFGAMFAPQQERVAAELVRVCRPGGRIGLANWTPDSFVGRMLKVAGRYVPQPQGVRSPLDWGTRGRIGEP